jgi:hypothetical protein
MGPMARKTPPAMTAAKPRNTSSTAKPRGTWALRTSRTRGLRISATTTDTMNTNSTRPIV